MSWSGMSWSVADWNHRRRVVPGSRLHLPIRRRRSCRRRGGAVWRQHRIADARRSSFDVVLRGGVRPLRTAADPRRASSRDPHAVAQHCAPLVGLYTMAPTQLIVARVVGSIIGLGIRRLPVQGGGEPRRLLDGCGSHHGVRAFRPHGYGPSTWLAAFVAALAADASQAVVLASAIRIFLGRSEPGLLRSQLLGTAAVPSTRAWRW